MNHHDIICKRMENINNLVDVGKNKPTLVFLLIIYA